MAAAVDVLPHGRLRACSAPISTVPRTPTVPIMCGCPGQPPGGAPRICMGGGPRWPPIGGGGPPICCCQRGGGGPPPAKSATCDRVLGRLALGNTLAPTPLLRRQYSLLIEWPKAFAIMLVLCGTHSTLVYADAHNRHAAGYCSCTHAHPVQPTVRAGRPFAAAAPSCTDPSATV